MRGAERSVEVNTANTIKLPEYSKPIKTTHLAEIFECSSSTILRRIHGGQLDAKPDGRKWRVLLEDLPAEYVRKATQK